MVLPHKLKILPLQHTGRLRTHEHTSYLPLAILLFTVGIVLGSFTVFSQSPGPAEGSVSLTGTVHGDAPTVAATITSPEKDVRFLVSPIDISGTCPQNTTVQIYKNDIFAGSSVCSSEGQYSSSIDLLFGENKLVARVYDALNQAGPNSTEITVYYDALPAQTDPTTVLDFGGQQLLINTDAVFRGAFPKQELTIPVEIIGGSPPYAVNIQWGDATNKIVSRDTAIPFNAGHAYSKAGTYQISLQVSDAKGRVAFLTVAAIVNGQPESAGTASVIGSSSGSVLVALWPLYASSVAIVISFWLGERREKALLLRHGIVTYSS